MKAADGAPSGARPFADLLSRQTVQAAPQTPQIGHEAFGDARQRILRRLRRARSLTADIRRCAALVGCCAARGGGIWACCACGVSGVGAAATGRSAGDGATGALLVFDGRERSTGWFHSGGRAAAGGAACGVGCVAGAGGGAAAAGARALLKEPDQAPAEPAAPPVLGEGAGLAGWLSGRTGRPPSATRWRF